MKPAMKLSHPKMAHSARKCAVIVFRTIMPHFHLFCSGSTLAFFFRASAPWTKISAFFVKRVKIFFPKKTWKFQLRGTPRSYEDLRGRWPNVLNIFFCGKVGAAFSVKRSTKPCGTILRHVCVRCNAKSPICISVEPDDTFKKIRKNMHT
jgi:hypothetical protein